ncbi:alpha/beta fold hydrolase [Catalinimonas niigatensis]|uniref:alpha/beta fold hydrolase n=1 Tax=Catalinimonas niigatensis TaxID=1397264 RepID=UPI002665E160|nr:alpha/beta hydrolase [Catalinimonas niigatensis]WPP49982.1 alpha/beta hydrolase [Catalinimonas niigatensis]
MQFSKFLFSLMLSLLLMVSVMGQSIQSDEFLSEGAKIHYVTAGSGTPLILIHGFSDNISICYQDTLDREGTTFISKLAKRYKVIALDVKGHGKSDKPIEAHYYGKELQEDVIRLMDHLGIEKAHVMGYSMGAFITGNLLIDYPERLISATLIGGAPLTQSQYSPDHELISLINATSEALEKGEGITPLLQWFWPGHQAEPSLEELGQINKKILTEQDTEALKVCMASLTALCQVDEEKLMQSDIPVTLINGTDDPLRHDIVRFQRLKRSNSVLIDGANHMDILMYAECLEAVDKSLSLVDMQVGRAISK